MEDKDFGTIRLNRGNISGTDESPMRVVWDAVPQCRGELCSIYHLCAPEYAPQLDEPCAIIHGYLESVSTVIFRNFKEQLEEVQWLRIGYELVPLYKTLCRLKMYELGLDSLFVLDTRGSERLNPVFREIRETIKIIEHVWKTIGLDNLEGSIKPPNPRFSRFVGGKPNPANLNPDGDPSYYANMEKEARERGAS